MKKPDKYFIDFCISKGLKYYPGIACSNYKGCKNTMESVKGGYKYYCFDCGTHFN